MDIAANRQSTMNLKKLVLLVTTLCVLQGSTGYQQKWNICDNGKIYFTENSYSGVNYVGQLYIDLETESSNYTDSFRFIDSCKCRISADEPFDIQLKMIKDTYAVDKDCLSNTFLSKCKDVLQIRPFKNGQYISTTYNDINAWSKHFDQIANNLFVETIPFLTIYYERDLTNPPSVKKLAIKLTANQPMTVRCSTTGLPIQGQATVAAVVETTRSRPVDNTSNNTKEDNHNFLIIIGGLVAGAVVVILLIILITLITARKRRKSTARRDQSTAQRPIYYSRNSNTRPASGPANGPANNDDNRYVDLEQMREIDKRVKYGDPAPVIQPDGMVSFGPSTSVQSNGTTRNEISPTAASQQMGEYIDIRNNNDLTNRTESTTSNGDTNYYNVTNNRTSQDISDAASNTNETQPLNQELPQSSNNTGEAEPSYYNLKDEQQELLKRNSQNIKNELKPTANESYYQIWGKDK